MIEQVRAFKRRHCGKLKKLKHAGGNRPGRMVLKDEVRAGIRARTEIFFELYGGTDYVAKKIGVHRMKTREWLMAGAISPTGCYIIQDRIGMRSKWLRPDLEFEKNGKPITYVCKKPKYLRPPEDRDYQPGGCRYKKPGKLKEQGITQVMRNQGTWKKEHKVLSALKAKKISESQARMIRDSGADANIDQMIAEFHEKRKNRKRG